MARLHNNTRILRVARIVHLRLLATALLASPAAAGDYKPINCVTASSYAGTPLASPPDFATLPSPTPASGSFDAATTARLEAALSHALVATPVP
jgi:hypothetical protein